MRILIVGGGGREHALVWKLAGERQVSEIVCAPGNAGMARVARTVAVDSGDPDALLDLAESEQVDFTMVGPELPLSLGLVDRFTERGHLAFGPTRRAAALESSKVFAKEFMTRQGVPTADYIVCRSAADALDCVRRGDLGFPIVLKADGLAAGKGVVIAADQKVAEAAIRAAMLDRRFGDAGRQLVLEEHLEGREASFFVISDGTRFVPLVSAEDHKRMYDGDRGPNTGGMGAFAPSPLLAGPVRERVLSDIVGPVIDGMRGEGREFRGLLYTGLMLTSDGPKVIEFNVRFGDPEAQVILPMLDEDLLPIVVSAAVGQLDRSSCRFKTEPHVGVVLASAGYPDSVQNGRRIIGIDDAEAAGALVFHAGTARDGSETVTAGGRILTIVADGPDYSAAIRRAYDAVALISFDGMQFRRDIGAKALDSV